MTKTEALHKFYSSFGIPAFEQNSVPQGKDKPEFPYLTYDVVTSGFGDVTALTLNLWYRSYSWLGVEEKAEEISAALGRGGKIITCDDGAIWLRRGSPFAQSMGDPDDELIKRKYINIAAEYLTVD